MSQKDRILSYLKRRPLTPIQALEKFGCFRLAARIEELRSEGYQIKTERVERGEKRYARYRLEKQRPTQC